MVNGSFGAKVSYFWVGAGLGALVGMLLAPKSGVQSREEMTQMFLEGKEYAKHKARELQERANNAIESGRELPERISNAFEAGREAYRREMSKPS